MLEYCKCAETHLEQPHRSDSVVAVEGEAVKDTSWDDDQVVLLNLTMKRSQLRRLASRSTQQTARSAP